MARARPVGTTHADGGAWLLRIAGPLLDERERWPLWAPVALGIGVIAYFEWPREPPILFGGTALSLGVVAAAVSPRALRLILLVPVLIALGFLAAQIRAERVHTPMIAAELGPVDVSGRIVEQSVDGGRVRLTLDSLRIEGLEPAQTPTTVRLSAPMAPPPVGAQVDGVAIILPPSAPVLPGGYDFRRSAYFDGLGGIGYFLGAPDIHASAGRPPVLWLEHVREVLGADIRQGMGEGASTGIAVALLTGERAGIDDATAEALRRAGLAHLLAISGLHVGLVAGLVFFATRAGLALSERLALDRPIKKWAALAALAAAFAYMLIVGSTVPTQRAFLMTALVLLAVCLDRTAISMRLVAWAAVAVLLMAPESLMGPSFQMSFAAVVALVAAYEAMAPRWGGLRQGAGPLRRMGLYLLGVAMTSLIAGSATAPFALYHFQQVASYGLIANLLAVPLMAFWIMPWGVVTYLLAPLGLSELSLAPMGWGIDAMLAIAHDIAGWPGAWWRWPLVPAQALALVVFGGLWLCLWQGRWRRWGWAGIGLGAILALTVSRPDVLLGPGGSHPAARVGDTLYLLGERPSGFVLDQWQRGIGASAVAPRPQGRVMGDDLALGCDVQACVIDRLGQRISVVADPAVWLEACADSTLVVALIAVPDRCPATIIDARREDMVAGASLRVIADGTVLRSVAVEQGDRPWQAGRGPGR